MNHGAMRPFNVTTATSTMFDPQAMYIASMVAEMEVNGGLTNPQCVNGTIPYLNMDGVPIAVNDTGYTIVDDKDGLQTVYEAVSWIPDMNDGTWRLATFQVDSMLSYRP